MSLVTHLSRFAIAMLTLFCVATLPTLAANRSHPAEFKPHTEEVHDPTVGNLLTEIKRYEFDEQGRQRVVNERYHYYHGKRTTTFRQITYPQEHRILKEIYSREGGKLFAKEERVNGVRVGTFELIHSSGKHEIIHYDDQGKKNGLALVKNGDEIIKSVNWIHGKMDGLYLRVLIDGRIEQHYQDGYPEGEYRMTAKDGRVLDHGYFVDGKRQGKWQETGYYNSHLMWHGNYDRGRKKGLWQLLDADHYLLKAGNYDDVGNKTGVWTFYDSEGKLTDCLLFRDDEQVAVERYNEASSTSFVEYCKSLPAQANP